MLAFTFKDKNTHDFCINNTGGNDKNSHQIEFITAKGLRNTRLFLKDCFFCEVIILNNIYIYLRNIQRFRIFLDLLLEISFNFELDNHVVS